MGMIDIIEDSIRKIIKERSDNGSRLKEQKNTEVKKDKKGFFYSEDDFRVSLILEFEKDYHKFDVFYEYSEKDDENKKRIDILLESGVIEYPIELKYLYYTENNKDFYGSDEIAKGIGYDINKIKKVVTNSKHVEFGYCILLTENKENINENIKKQLENLVIKNGTLSGIIKWKETKTIEKEITIKESLLTRCDTIENFRYLIIEISKESAEKIISDDK